MLTETWPSCHLDDRVVFVTGGAGSICSVQTKAMVYLGANACIIGRNVEKTERIAKEIASVRKGAKVIGIGAVDVRSVGGPLGILSRSNRADQHCSLRVFRRRPIDA